jgi:hypothetical protein
MPVMGNAQLLEAIDAVDAVETEEAVAGLMTPLIVATGASAAASVSAGRASVRQRTDGGCDLGDPLVTNTRVAT